MRKLLIAAAFAFVVYLELFIVAQPLMSGNPARAPYRRKERHAALEAVRTNQSPETEAALHDELRLASRYEMKQKLRKCIPAFAAFLLLDAVAIYAYLKPRDANGKSAQGPPAANNRLPK